MRLDTIEASRIDGTNRSVILSMGLDAPRALALDPKEGYVLSTLLYYSDHYNSNISLTRTVKADW